LKAGTETNGGFEKLPGSGRLDEIGSIKTKLMIFWCVENITPWSGIGPHVFLSLAGVTYQRRRSKSSVTAVQSKGEMVGREEGSNQLLHERPSMLRRF
jgi:hypothetical protein